MIDGEPARARARRTRWIALGAVLALIVAAVALTAVGSSTGEGGRTQKKKEERRTRFPSGAWPQQGQAAIVLGGGRAAVSPDQKPAAIASLAKVMTAYLTLKHHPLRGDDDGFTVTVTAAQAEEEAEDRAEGESVVPVAAGERLSERQLLEALLVPSGNNVARILAPRVAGDESSFLDEMNAEAEALGMDETTYTDPSGFDSGTVSTAADQLRLFRAAMRFPLFRRIVSTTSVTLPVAGTLTNFNPLVAEGYRGKTGSDAAAGGCLAFFTQVTVGGHRKTAVGVVMGQGEGNETAAILAAAAEAAEGLVDSATVAAGGRTSGRSDEPLPQGQSSGGATLGVPGAAPEP